MESLRWILLVAGLGLIGWIYWLGRRHERARHEGLVERARREAQTGAGDAATGEPTGARADEGPPPASPDAPDLEIGPAMETLDADVADIEHLLAGSRERAGATPAAAEPADAAGGDEPAPGEAGPAQPAPEAGAPRAADDDGRDAVGGSGPDDGDAAEQLVVLYVVAGHGERLVGARLRAALERQGLRHGRMGIFHAHDDDGRTVFSVANVVEPGTFELATMDTMTTPGMALFMGVPGPQAAETAFDRMLATARALADELDARVLDGAQSTLTRQREQHLREELRLADLRPKTPPR